MLAYSLFEQHIVIAFISSTAVIAASLIGVFMNRRMARIEISVNGRIDALLAEIKRLEAEKTANREAAA